MAGQGTGHRGARERRFVSVLFCDLVGFTDFSDNADPEDVDALLESYFSRARGAIEAFGGVVEKFIGDAVVGVFGHPVAHDDDPERAVRTGLAIIEAVAAAQHDGGPWLPVRVGINTGEALLRRGVDPASGEGFMAGDMVNVAARIQHEADPMTVLVGPDTYQVTAQVFDFVKHGTVTLRGKSEPVELFQPLTALARLGSDLTRRHDAPFVGRAVELDLLTTAFEQLVTDRSSVLVRVVGEPGIGKSRLVGQFLDQVQQEEPGLVWRTGRCLPYGDQAGIWALGEIVRSHLGVADTDPVDVVTARLEAELPPGPDRGWLRQRLLPLLGVQISQPGSAAEQLAAWSRFLRDAVAAGPAVLVFEDVHWADDTLLRFVHQLVNDATDQPLMVVVTTRPEHRLDTVVEPAAGDDEGEDEEAPQPASSQLALSLSPLDEAASRALLAALLARPSVPDVLAATVMARANGNPLFLGELVRLLRDRHLIEVDAHGAWRLAAGTEIPVPDSLHGVIAARYDLLPESTRTTLATASVLGRTFWPAAVETMHPDVKEALVADLGLAAERDLITLVPSTMTGEVEYAFFHALTRDVIYTTMPRDLRAAHHEAAAAWLKNQLDERAEEIADILAHHYTTAIDLHIATGRPDQATELKPEAAHYLYASARQAAGTDKAAAVVTYQRAVDLLDSDHPDRIRLLSDYATSLTDAGRLADALTVGMQAVDAAQRRGDEMELARAQLAVLEPAVFDPALAPFDVRALRREWIERVLGLPPNELTIEALCERARMVFQQGRAADAVAWAQQAVEVAEATGRQRCQALNRRGALRLLAGEAEGLADLEAAIAAGRETGDTYWMCIVYINVSLAERFVGPARLLPLIEQGLRLALDRGFLTWARSIAGNLIDTLLEAGQVDRAMQLQSHLDAEARGDSARAVVSESMMLARLIDLVGGSEQRQQLIRRLNRLDVPGLVAESGETFYARDALDAAAYLREPQLFSTFLPHVGQISDLRKDDQFVSVILNYVGAALALPDVNLAQELITDLDLTNPMLEHCLIHAQAMIDEHTGHQGTALSGYLEAAERWRSFTHVLYRSDALLGAARCHAALGHADQARDLLNQARNLYDTMPAPAKVAECDNLLANLS